MACVGEQGGATPGIPELHRAINAGRSNTIPVWHPGNTFDTTPVAAIRDLCPTFLATSYWRPNLDGLIPRTGGDLASIWRPGQRLYCICMTIKLEVAAVVVWGWGNMII